jgi:16S rRNA processing protein RimM
VPVGRIVKPWGRRGEVLAEVDVDDVAHLTGCEMLIGEEQAVSPVRVTRARLHGRGRAVLKLEGTDSIDQAERFRGATLFDRRSRVSPPPEGSYYAFQLLGLRVITTEGREVGRIAEIRPTGGADLLVVRGEGRERLVPFARSICTRVDLENGVIRIDPPEGLLELDEV